MFEIGAWSFPALLLLIFLRMPIGLAMFLAGVGGLWLWVFLGELKKQPILPQQDPRAELMFLKEKAHSHA